MRLISSALALLLGSAAAAAAKTWSFDNGRIDVVSHGAGGGAAPSTYKFGLEEPVVLGHGDKLKVSLTTKEGGEGKKPHQAFLVLREKGGLEAPFALTVKGSGKGSVEITQKDIPIQLLVSEEPLSASIIIGSFGASDGSISPVFDLSLKLNPAVPRPTYEAELRYGKKEEIHHTFRPEPTNPPKAISMLFALGVLATIPALFVGWVIFGGNVCDAQKALGSSPIAHITFFGSLIAMEGVFLMYYVRWTLFATLPVAGLVGVVAFLSGNKALGEVQRRRLAGQR